MKVIVSVIIFCCFAKSAAAQYSWNPDQTKGNVESRFAPPAGYARVKVEQGSFGAWLRKFPLKSPGTQVMLFNGQSKPNQDFHAAVLNIDVGNKDLQQCADAVIRLRTEYLYSKQAYTDIHFNFTNGFLFDFNSWSKGKRVKVTGNKTEWVQSATADNGYKTLKSYLQMAFSYCGTLSLNKEMKPIAAKDIMPGDVFIVGGSPGHAVIVIDVVQNTAGEKMFMIAQSYMPAQDIHILKNPNSSGSVWYKADFGETLVTPEWLFSKEQVRRF